MAWPKGRRRTIKPKASPDIGAEVGQILGHPVASEATSSAGPTVDQARVEANRAQMLCYIRGEFVPRHLRVHWDQRNVPIVDRVRAAMLRDRATPDKAEAYLDAELARR